MHFLKQGKNEGYAPSENTKTENNRLLAKIAQLEESNKILRTEPVARPI
jgi:hypothetical protein